MLLNFVIAILSNTYSVLTSRSNAIYLKQVIVLNQLIGYEEGYSAMVSGFPGLNLLLAPVYPFLLKFNSKRFNTVVLMIEFVPVALVGIAIWLLVTALATLTTFGLLILAGLRQTLASGARLKALKFTFLFSLIGLPFLGWMAILDFVTFLKSVFNMNPHT